MSREIMQQALDALGYDPETGNLFWKQSRGTKKVGSIAGYFDIHGYVCVKLHKKQYRAHRLAWFFHYGEMPVDDIDHIDGNKSNNKISNLRLATEQLNQWNHTKPRVTNSTGYLGVSKYRNKYIASIKANYKSKRLGVFDTSELAHQAYLKAKQILHKGAIL